MDFNNAISVFALCFLMWIIHPSIRLSVDPSTCLSIHSSVHPPFHPLIRPSVCLSRDPYIHFSGVCFCKPDRYLWKPLWPKNISAGDIFGPESVSVKIYYGWNTCWATSPNPPGKISFRDVFKERYLFLQNRTPGILDLMHQIIRSTGSVHISICDSA